MATLAAKYGVSEKTICKVIHADKDFPQKVSEEKERSELGALEYIISRRERAQSLIDAFLDITPDMIRKTSIRDRMGAVKILTETFLIHRDGEDEEDKKIDICISVQDLTVKEESGEG